MSTSSQDIERRATDYATARGQRLEDRLGFGRDGSVFSTDAGTAVKSFAGLDPFERELRCYQRLFEHDVDKVLGHQVPRLVGWDEKLLVLEMTIVSRPYLLDFAS